MKLFNLSNLKIFYWRGACVDFTEKRRYISFAFKQETPSWQALYIFLRIMHHHYRRRSYRKINWM